MPEYLRKLRALVGNLPIVVCGASVIVVNKAGEVLLQLRSDNGNWGVPGGVLDINENTEDAAKRELYEETGITANSLELLGVFSGEELFYTYPNGHQCSIVDVCYICRDFTGVPKADLTESVDTQFFDVNSFPVNFMCTCKPALRKYFSDIGVRGNF